MIKVVMKRNKIKSERHESTIVFMKKFNRSLIELILTSVMELKAKKKTQINTKNKHHRNISKTSKL